MKLETVLCPRCVDMLGKYFLIKRVGSAKGTCPWFEQSKSETVYAVTPLSVQTYNTFDNIVVLTRNSADV